MYKESRIDRNKKVMYIVGGINPMWDEPYSDIWGRFSEQSDATQYRNKLKSVGFKRTYIKKRVNIFGYKVN